ncbi:MAG: histidine kinase [Treponema sp.]|jgi:two-component system NarL family sensor kinase|nr:histidine kinase [Treponema sp.]
MVPAAAFSEEIEVYFRLLWLFVFILSVLILLLWYFYTATRKAREQEQESRDFSRLIITELETERRRISGELHDTVLPELRLLAGSGGEAADGVALIRRQELVSRRIREICLELMPPDFTRLSLKDSLTGLCLQFARRTGLECVPSIDRDVDFSHLDPEAQLHLYRIVQEALTNIEKHSGAGQVVLVARRQTSMPGGPGAGSSAGILVCISDDGAGLKPEDPPKESTSLGMRIMHERAAAIGARLDFVSESGNGLMVRIELPPIPSSV